MNDRMDEWITRLCVGQARWPPSRRCNRPLIESKRERKLKTRTLSPFLGGSSGRERTTLTRADWHPATQLCSRRSLPDGMFRSLARHHDVPADEADSSASSIGQVSGTEKKEPFTSSTGSVCFPGSLGWWARGLLARLSD